MQAHMYMYIYASCSGAGGLRCDRLAGARGRSDCSMSTAPGSMRGGEQVRVYVAVTYLRLLNCMRCTYMHTYTRTYSTRDDVSVRTHVGACRRAWG